MITNMIATSWRWLKYIAAVTLLTSCIQTTALTQIVNPVSVISVAAPVVKVVNLSDQRLQQVPVTFGQPFRSGDIPHGETVMAYLGDEALPTQSDIKARNSDGSVRHAVLTVLIPRLEPKASETLILRPAFGSKVNVSAVQSLTIGEVLRTHFEASIQVNIAGKLWHLSARKLLRRSLLGGSCITYGRECSQWLSGPLVSEWVVGGPLINEQGKPNAHLAVYFAIRAYGPLPIQRVRVDVIVGNDWAYAPNPHNERYDATIAIDGQVVYSVHNLEHYRQARWHKAFWWGTPNLVYAELNSRYLQDSRAVPRYEDVNPPQSLLSKVRQSCEPMQSCDQTATMANTGAQAAIGPLTRWSSVYVIDPTYYAYRWMLANSDALGAYGIHYRDQFTGQPVSVEAHPCMTLIGAAEVAHCHVIPHKNDTFPRCSNQCKSPLIPDESHHPEPAYVAYLVTGDWYYLEELKFWSDWIIFQQNPAYRGYAKGLIQDTQVRGQAWALRSLGYAAYILPDNDPFKSYLNRVVENNIQWYNQNYTDNPRTNALHILTNGYAIVYPNQGKPDTGIAVWQQSYFNWSVGNLVDLGFPGADKLSNWFSAFQINLMTSPDYCWIVASAYELQVRDSKDSPIYSSLRQAYEKTFPELKGVTCNTEEMAALLSKPHGYRYLKGVMVGYPYSPTGFVANFQIGLAVAADSNIPEARKAWDIFTHRQAKPNYGDSPQFAIIPRRK